MIGVTHVGLFLYNHLHFRQTDSLRSQIVVAHHISEMRDLTFAQSISVKRFFKDALEDKDIKKFSQVAESLDVV